MANHYDKQFKLDAIQYYTDHTELGLKGGKEPWHKPAIPIPLEEGVYQHR